MKNKNLLATICLAALVSVAQAAPAPEKCPSIKAVQAVGFSEVTKSEDITKESWVAKQKGNFDTQQQWAFMMLFPYHNEADPMKKALEMLAGLHKAFGPLNDEDQSSTCIYVNMDSKGVGGLAITPPDALDKHRLK